MTALPLNSSGITQTGSSPTTILIADDNIDMVDGLSWYLEAAGYEVLTAHDGEEAIKTFSLRKPDMVVLDIMMPKLDGVSVCESIRKDSGAYIIMLSARDADVDKIRALDKGADDYVTKPFSSAELVSRIKAMFRRSARAPQGAASLRWNDLEVFIDERVVRVKGQVVNLTILEFDLLTALMRRMRTVLSRNQLTDLVWSDPGYYGGLRLVDNQIYRLREKLLSAGLDYCPIVTVRGVGYAFRPEG